MASIKVINFLARNSCTRFQKVRTIRVICRKIYRQIANTEAKKAAEAFEPSTHGYVNTYPAVFSSPKVANWEEDDSVDGYSLVSDPSGFIIKYATSYCNWKVRELTGKWLRRPATKTHANDSAAWVDVLAYNGYSKLVEAPENGHHYIGVNPIIGEYGLVVWYHESTQSANGVDTGEVLASTYQDHKYNLYHVNAADFVWVEID